jgi:hypothetical protein
MMVLPRDEAPPAVDRFRAAPPLALFTRLTASCEMVAHLPAGLTFTIVRGYVRISPFANSGRRQFKDMVPVEAPPWNDCSHDGSSNAR